MPLTRRALLAAACVLPSAARAFLDASRFIPAVARHGGRWDLRASGLRRLAWELQNRTSVEVALEARPVALDSPALFQYPFVYLSSDRAMTPLNPAEVENLRRYLTFGGFLFAEANEDAFDASFRAELARVLPQAPLAALPSTHVVYRTFFLLDTPAGRVLNRPYLEAAVVNRRAAVIYSQNDVLGAMNRDEAGAWEFEPSPGGARQRELATRLAINIAMYALCLDYKDDAVHLPAILERRRVAP
jgi:hypothetical protein